jgi:hypothetical protein
MMPLQNTSTKVAIKPQSVTAGATASGYVDCLGYEEAAVSVLLDSQASTTSNPSVLKLAECDTTVTTSFVDIAAFTGDATDGFTIPAAGTAATVVRLNVDLRKRKRYLKVFVSPEGATQVIAASVTLGKASDSTIARAEMSGVVDG